MINTQSSQLILIAPKNGKINGNSKLNTKSSEELMEHESFSIDHKEKGTGKELQNASSDDQANNEDDDILRIELIGPTNQDIKNDIKAEKRKRERER
jgi:hypothetical protein